MNKREKAGRDATESGRGGQERENPVPESVRQDCLIDTEAVSRSEELSQRRKVESPKPETPPMEAREQEAREQEAREQEAREPKTREQDGQKTVGREPTWEPQFSHRRSRETAPERERADADAETSGKTAPGGGVTTGESRGWDERIRDGAVLILEKAGAAANAATEWMSVLWSRFREGVAVLSAWGVVEIFVALNALLERDAVSPVVAEEFLTVAAPTLAASVGAVAASVIVGNGFRIGWGRLVRVGSIRVGLAAVASIIPLPTVQVGEVEEQGLRTAAYGLWEAAQGEMALSAAEGTGIALIAALAALGWIMSGWVIPDRSQS